MAGNLAVRIQDGVIGLAMLAMVTAALREWMVRIVPPILKPATVRSSHRPYTKIPTGYAKTR